MLNRRDMMKMAASAGVALWTPYQEVLGGMTNGRALMGWVPQPQEVAMRLNSHQLQTFGQKARHLSGSGRGKRALLWKYFEQVTGNALEPHDQGIGDCVSHGWGFGADILGAVQIKMHNANEKFVAKAATEPIYAGSRVEIGGGKIKIHDGSTGIWASDYVQQYGILLRQQYRDQDLRTYSAAKAREWGKPRHGVPDQLESIAREHPIKDSVLVTNWNDAMDAMHNGAVIPICSKQGFRERRDRQGFCKPWGTWYHCMLLCGYDDTTSRSGGLILNSWGPDWVTGPKRLEQPDGSFWADASVIDKMLRQEDSYAIRSLVGWDAGGTPLPDDPDAPIDIDYDLIW